MISKTKVVISNEISKLWSGGSRSPNEQDPRYNEDGFRATYSRKITADFLWGKGQLSMHTLTYKIASNRKKSLLIFIFIPLSSKPSSLYVSNSTFPSPQKKNNNEYHWIVALQSWIKVGHRWPFVLMCVHVTVVRNMEVRRVVATLPWAFDELWLRSIPFRKQNQAYVGLRIEV